MRQEVKIGLFVIAILTVLGYFIIRTGSLVGLLSRGKRYEVVAKFSTVSDMYASAPIRLAGVQIGVVEKIYLEGKKAVAVLLIDKNMNLFEDARAIISTVGFVGEKYVEIVYRDEFKMENPRILKPNEEIKTIEPFSLDKLQTKVDILYEKMVRSVDSINELISDPKSRQYFSKTLENLNEISDQLNHELSQDGDVHRTIREFKAISGTLADVSSSLKKIVNEIESSLDGKEGILAALKNTMKKVEQVSEDFKGISSDIKEGRGTAGKLLKNEQIYEKISDSVNAIQSILKDFEATQKKLSAVKFSYGMRFDYFTVLSRMRTAIDLNLDWDRFSIMGGVTEDPLNGDYHFSLMAGKTFKWLSISGGLLESNLGAAVRLIFFDKKVNLDIQVSKWYLAETPNIKTFISFSLSRNLRLYGGYVNLFNRENRRFFLGFGLYN